MCKKEEKITHLEIWEFIQAHKGETKDEFGKFLLGQLFETSDKIVKAVCFWNEQKTGVR